ncbi:TPR domain protein, SEL1 repeat subfamily [Citrifermentans bemidjiense Bem]|uniref:TPR domain protein, SEL1 repeat subfamily n=1 Tax=Citrifermentans bemidjiense (strain ATCC BAA-1014 / DSM 16622 / JCM 12645 / Bem) TaxID=404380 RepID=B5EH47_CITBB|nr:tetratricopeptide repeat protein [Citrifermentans bemidjiense]ACH38149.1 TPR domain protein, SEL1 repeat subfamily [Citrifermentans bemidjiense Bem]
MKRRIFKKCILSTAVIAGVCFLTLPVRADYGKGRELYLMKDYQNAMKQFMFDEDPGSLYMVAYMYEHGEGVTEDGAKASEWYMKAAEKGSVKAMYRLGVMYANGYGVDKDENEAIKWFKKASFKGFAPAKDALKRLTKGTD